jgi:hypothetical protein
MGDGNIELRTKISFKVILFPVNRFLVVGTYGKERKKVGRPLMVLLHDYIRSDFCSSFSLASLQYIEKI